ncbi:hypothetical protein B0T21DRAFT_379686 [Apiosordaria backusii]|uniref:Uncharacterized protein n=1 Tax=Apiosordaria backusii TaxID=314023 RepID=A0AA40EY50_9PEZI|nr:hypothetical protein B0T21DRAFT_379686 [Apiosordaria backusii]
MKLFTLSLSILCLFTSPISANVEKTIFLAPPAVHAPIDDPTIISNLKLARLTPHPANQSSLRTLLPVSFPTTSHPQGTESWFLLWDLTPSQRYEVRICWAATQPTSFHLQTFTTSEIFSSTPSFTSYLDSLPLSPSPPKDVNTKTPHSYLLLRILAAADFYTTNKTLMSHPPPVIADIILDPFLFNILPRSLAPTVGYIIAVAISSWFLAGGISRAFKGLITNSHDIDNNNNDKKRQ